MNTLVWALVAFASGSLMFSYWFVRLAGKDIRAVGDGNPGATNTFIAAGFGVGVAAVLFDSFKALIPVYAAQVNGIDGAGLVVVAFAPLLGHAFSPFLRGRGGKAVMTLFGSWCALSLWQIPTIFGVLLGVGFALISVSGWALVWALAALLAYLVVTGASGVWLGFWACSTLLLLYTYRHDLRRFPVPRPWLARRLAGLPSSVVEEHAH